jgi:serine protease DegS
MKTSTPYVIILGLIFGAAIAWFVSYSPLESSQQPISFADAVDRAAPTVVNIYTTKLPAPQQPQNSNNPFFNLFFDQQSKRIQQERELSLGSGVLLHEDGFILTNYHVIKDAEEILVLLYDGRKTLARISGIDKETDLAVLKIDLANLQAIKIGDSNSMRIGDPVLAIGNPFGFGQTVTAGIISGKGRYGLNLNTYEDFIQTDAAINVGSSGGALINYKGELIGISTAMYSQSGGSQGIGLAIPAEITRKVLNDIIRHGQVVRGWLGLEVAQINDAIAARLQLNQNSGIVITDTYHNGPAENAGLRAGDIITEINDQTINNGHKGLLEVANLSPGESIRVSIIRNNKPFTVQAVIGMRPDLN